eukprot:gnl/TRDRNA2_/TRDRNA2_187400_c0_seq1.p2 gnl/TRDRNA2_/TRDRNA2_187400_c0~~gnl/TRDRNA2_/TRDRNA2_187400_c0_seq1.p2  ORF type:complete len:195 (+),score=36.44 gnl/TRDRNA2_/TRDRNA2_187400_c0_seq1:70-654(+)
MWARGVFIIAFLSLLTVDDAVKSASLRRLRTSTKKVTNRTGTFKKNVTNRTEQSLPLVIRLRLGIKGDDTPDGIRGNETPDKSENPSNRETVKDVSKNESLRIKVYGNDIDKKEICTCRLDKCLCREVNAFLDCLEDECSKDACRCDPNAFRESCEKASQMCEDLPITCTDERSSSSCEVPEKEGSCNFPWCKK